MMLRASVDEGGRDPRGLLEALVDAVTARTSRPDDEVAARTAGDQAEPARRAVIEELGPDWLVDACAVVANFEMMTRIADGTGARLRHEQLDAAAGIIAQQRLDAFTSARR